MIKTEGRIFIINKEIDTDEKTKIQYILNEDEEITEIPKEKCVPVERPIKCKLLNAFEVFVPVCNTENYWISNYGRCASNIRHKDKNKFYISKVSHYTMYIFDRYEIKTKKGMEPHVDRYKYDDYAVNLVARAFLGRCSGAGGRIWHKDGDKSNNWYKNLLKVSDKDYNRLRAGKVKWQDLNIKQEYIEYENKTNYYAYQVYNGIKDRCKSVKNSSSVHACYNNVTMCQEWIDNPLEFIKWYYKHYYEIDGESMAVDKDLFGTGEMYHPDYCCILPQGLNTMLTNCKKHYFEGQTSENTLPLGVTYSNGKYRAKIRFTKADKDIFLSEWDTPEEAFSEYKMMKQADMLRVIAEYKEHIPDYIYKKLLTVEVKPY